MSIIIFPTKNQDILLPILRNPELFKLTNGQDSTQSITNIEIDNAFTYLAIALNEKIVGLLSLKPLTHMVIEGHIALLPEYWQTGLSIKIIKEGSKYLYINTIYRKIITLTPGNCTKVINLLKKCDYKQCGCIEEGIVYNNKLTNLLLFEYDLNRGK